MARTQIACFLGSSQPQLGHLEGLPQPSFTPQQEGLGGWNLWFSWQQCPSVPTVSNGTWKSPQHGSTRTKGSQQGDAFTSRAEVMQPGRKMTTHDVLRVPSPALQSLEKNICVWLQKSRSGWEHCPGCCQPQAVSSGEGCFLFGLFQIRKLCKVQLRESYPDCRDCLFPVLAGLWMMHE